MVSRKLWRVSGYALTINDKQGQQRVVIVTANNFAAAHDRAHAALEHNPLVHTLQVTGSRIESISPVRNDRGDPMEVLIPELE